MPGRPGRNRSAGSAARAGPGDKVFRRNDDIVPARLLAGSPVGVTRRQRTRLDWLVPRLGAAAQSLLAASYRRVDVARSALRALGPQETLNRGYAIVTGHDGQVLTDASQAAAGSNIQARLARGILHARVREKNNSG